MELKPGDKLGPYEIVSAIGRGGMGEVWKARDPRLNRDVAIKTSRLGFSGRFKTEAQTIAALNHPNICTLFDVGPDYLVMEYIEGPTMADRIRKGAIPLDEVLLLAKQMADALEAAHEKGIVHRDLKPANVKIRPDGSVKVLDFGLAKSAAEPVELTSDSPTLMSMSGMILGTAGYMSPEQARGQESDKRADIWAFGVVLYEMLTTKRLFDGATISDSLAAILTREADLTVAPEKTRRLLASCLEKDPRKRLRDIGDWARQLEITERVASAPSQSQLGKAGWVAAVALGLLAVAAIYFRGAKAEVPETRVDIVTPTTSQPGSLALSPDGRRIAYVASGDGARRLWVRSLDSTSPQPLPGADGASSPFWSPDGRSLGFFADLKLKRIDLAGGQPQTLAEAPTSTGQGSWSTEGVILFNPGQYTSLFRVPASGGRAVPATKLEKGQSFHRAPRFLPGGKQFLFTIIGADSAIWLGSLDGGEPRRIATIGIGADSEGEFIAPGWLVRARQGILVAQRFDAASGQLSGEPVSLAQAVGVDQVTLAGAFSVSPFGIAWRAGGGGRKQLMWFNRAGQSVGTFGAASDSNLFFPELSPDGKRVAITRGPVGSGDIWLQEGTRSSRFTFDPADDRYIVWSPDGERVVFASSRTGNYDLYLKNANGSGSEDVLLHSPDNKRPNSWSPDGRFLLYSTDENNGDLIVLPLTGDRKAFPFLSTPFNERQGAFSPDGKWVAYASNESGRNEVYVRPFPTPGGQWQISTSGGDAPRWRADGKELYYMASDGKLMAVAVAQGAAFAPGTPEALFQTLVSVGVQKPNYDVARDGRILVNTELSETANEPIHLLLNWKPPSK